MTDAWLLAMVHCGCRQLFLSSLHVLCTEPKGQEVFDGQTLHPCVYLIKGTAHLMPTMATGTLLTMCTMFYKSHI